MVVAILYVYSVVIRPPKPDAVLLAPLVLQATAYNSANTSPATAVPQQTQPLAQV
jgi:hypothetical protein